MHQRIVYGHKNWQNSRREPNLLPELSLLFAAFFLTWVWNYWPAGRSAMLALLPPGECFANTWDAAAAHMHTWLQYLPGVLFHAA